jgi:hypothetical protein
MITVVVEGDERADGLRIGDALRHAPMIPAAAEGPPHAHGAFTLVTSDP